MPGLTRALGGTGAARYGLAMSDDSTQSPSLDDVEVMARRALEDIPGEFRRHVQDVVIRVEEFPDRETERAMGLKSPFDLLGLYRGVSIDRKTVQDAPSDMDMIFLYRRPLLDYWCESSEPLDKIIRHVLIHEIGHHFGFSDEDMMRIEEKMS